MAAEGGDVIFLFSASTWAEVKKKPVNKPLDQQKMNYSGHIAPLASTAKEQYNAVSENNTSASFMEPREVEQHQPCNSHFF